jgi:hypothetical protein
LINRIILLVSVIVAASLNLSFRWPLDNAKITSTFGESRWDHFHDGIDIVSMDGKIYPVQDGELLYMWDRSIFPLDNYPGGGNYRVLEHADSTYSIYMHLSEGVSVKRKYSVGDIIGFTGNTGHSFARHLHFSIVNPAVNKSINPLTKMPAVSDTIKPQIMEFLVRIGDRYSIIKDKSSIRLTKHYPLLISIIDAASGRERLGIYKLSLELNGKSVIDVIFSEISFTKNGLTISGKRYDDLFDDKGFYKIKDVIYVDGINTVKAIARDFAGNESIKEISFNVKLEVQQP